jgi:hypothetical protein
VNIRKQIQAVLKRFFHISLGNIVVMFWIVEFLS